MSVRASAHFISMNSDHVQLNQEKIEKVAKELSQLTTRPSYSHPLHPFPTHPHAVDWIFLIDLLNFCFHSTSYKITIQETEYTGYWALCAALYRSIIIHQKPIHDPKLWATLDWYKIFESDASCDDIPLIQQRLQVIQDAGRILLTKWNGSIIHLIHEANQSAERLLTLLIDEFGYIFNDESEFKGRKVQFYKRAQIFIADIWACFEGKNEGKFHDIEFITMFADYRVPQGLAQLGILEYSPELLKILSEQELPYGDPLEVEIRGNSIEAVERIIKNTPWNAIQVDFYLWEFTKKSHVSHIPIHRTKSIYY